MIGGRSRRELRGDESTVLQYFIARAPLICTQYYYVNGVDTHFESGRSNRDRTSTTVDCDDAGNQVPVPRATVASLTLTPSSGNAAERLLSAAEVSHRD